MTLPTPEINESLLVRTDFSDDDAWEALRERLDEVELRYVDDPAFDGLTAAGLASLTRDRGEDELTYAFLADSVTMTDPEQSVMAVDLYDEPGRSFRVAPVEVLGVHANLSLANVDFDEFVAMAEPDGVYRGV
jgi:hypothetical protein